MMEWLDRMTKLWGTIDDGVGGSLQSYSPLDKFPKHIEKFPAVITYVNDVDPTYSVGGPCSLVYTGQSDFHLKPDLSLEGIPYVNAFYQKILVIMFGNMKLKVAGVATCVAWKIDPSSGGIHHVHFEYSDEHAHRGILVTWTVEENVSGKITVSA